ncbi:hypothetical protein OW763_07145 [Clostridium aestuarii]|uniref:Uncharacterized protein n=1 Tax=Clostridium aestuarii TaxID=338193 RepID=A0ABT4CYS7_9CLOT|nr:hypothetical protein [Clostridium aestuarii]MCY6484128.1 hypothetical protein [Clostridium aestuarii]
MMHTKLPEFILKMKRAVAKHFADKEIDIKGLENLKTAKMQSLRTGRIESAVEEIANDNDVKKVELVVMPRVPETMHTVVVKGIDKDGKPKKAILEVINILHPTEEVELEGCEEIDDRRPSLGKH